MNIERINVPLTLVASLVVFIISGVYTVEYRFTNAEDFEQYRTEQSISNSMLWIELLEAKLEKADTELERKKIQRQIDITTKSLYINMEKQSK